MSASPQLDASDLTKIHSEIVGYVFARSAIVLAILTTFGVALGAMATVVVDPHRVFLTTVFGIAALLIYALLCTVADMLLGDLQVLAQYLRATKASVWEEHSFKISNGFDRPKHFWRFGIGRQVRVVAGTVTLLTAIIPLLISLLPLDPASATRPTSDPLCTATIILTVILWVETALLFWFFVLPPRTLPAKFLCRNEKEWYDEWVKIVSE